MAITIKEVTNFLVDLFTSEKFKGKTCSKEKLFKAVKNAEKHKTTEALVRILAWSYIDRAEKENIEYAKRKIKQRIRSPFFTKFTKLWTSEKYENKLEAIRFLKEETNDFLERTKIEEKIKDEERIKQIEEICIKDGQKVSDELKEQILESFNSIRKEERCKHYIRI